MMSMMGAAVATLSGAAKMSGHDPEAVRLLNEALSPLGIRWRISDGLH
jgi:hypothetical protein